MREYMNGHTVLLSTVYLVLRASLNSYEEPDMICFLLWWLAWMLHSREGRRKFVSVAMTKSPYPKGTNMCSSVDV